MKPAASVAARAKLPNLDHFTLEDGQNVYEPAEDTFLLCDALLRDKDLLISRRPTAVLEIGCGSGCVICYLTMMLKAAGIPTVSFGIDVNRKATLLTTRTAAVNRVEVDTVLSDLGSNFAENSVDILIFNPPYVPTPSEEVGSKGIEAAWAGGINGREVIDKFLPLAEKLLAPGGRCYLVLVEENIPSEIAEYFSSKGFVVDVTVKTRARNEELMIMTIDKYSHR